MTFGSLVLGAACVLARTTTLVDAKVNFRGSGRLAKAEVKSDLFAEISLSDKDLSEYETGLQHMFVTMPKNAHGNLGHDAVRHALHRFFVHRHGWWLRGFELGAGPSNMAEEKDQVPQLLQDSFEKANLTRGATLHDLAALAASVELLVQREARAHLLDCFIAEDRPIETELDREAARDIAHTYFMSFILEHNWTVNGKEDLQRKSRIFEAKYPLYRNASVWLYRVFSEVLGGEQHIDFSKSLQVATRIGEQYHDVNDQECSDLNTALQSVESKKPGRVRLSVFYNMSLHSHWKFTESVSTLRNLGALDESDEKQKYVIIPNYAMARPNCVNASNIYEICCANACETVMRKIEQEVQDTTATAAHIVEVVSTIGTATVKAPRRLEYQVTSRLRHVAESHGGHVPLHGRLFRQWLHHVFPLECAYPHEAGTTNPQAWSGDEADQATAEEMQLHVQADVCSLNADGKMDCGEESAELPWSSAEELLIVGPIAPVAGHHEVAEGPSEVTLGLGLIALALVLLPFVVLGRSTERGVKKFGVPIALALAGLASLLGLLDPRVAVFGAVGGSVASVINQRTKKAYQGQPKSV